MKRKNKEDGRSYRNCDKCGLSWNVSPNVIKRKSYVCPACSNHKKSKANNK